MAWNQITAIVTDGLKVFVAAMLGQLIVVGTNVLSLDATGWKAIIASGLAALVVWAYNALDPTNTAYGRGAVPAA